MNNHRPLVKSIIVSAAGALCLCASQQLSHEYLNPHTTLNAGARRACIVPIDSVGTNYRDNTAAIPRSEVSDSFLVEAANAFVLFGMGKVFQAVPFPADSAMPSGNPAHPRYSMLKTDTLDLAAASSFVREIARRSGADVVVVPYQCALKYTVFQPEGWRGKYNNSYARPATYSAETVVDLQIWSKDGVLLIERDGTSGMGRPLFYSVFKRSKPKNDMVVFAKNIYSPPIIRSLYTAVQAAVKGL